MTKIESASIGPIWQVLCIVALVTVHVGLCAFGIGSFPNVDEVGHLPAGVSHWKYARFDLYRVNPPLVRLLCTSVSNSEQFDWSLYSERVGLRPEFDIGLGFLGHRKLHVMTSYFGPRIVAVSLSVLGLLIGYCWLKRLFSNCFVPLAFALFWAFSPMILANAPTICPDIGATSSGLLMILAYWVYTIQPSKTAASMAGLAFGTAVLTKLTWLTGAVTLPAIAIISIVYLQPHLMKEWRSRLFELLMATLLAGLVINLGYGLEKSLRPLAEFQFCCKTFGGENAHRFNPTNSYFGSSWVSMVRVPFPQNFILGIDYLKYEVEEKKWSFLNGEWKFGSWSYYYIMSTLYKTPEPTLLGALVGLGVLLTGIRRKMVVPEVISMFLFLIIPAAVCFASVSLQGGFNHHHRYVLMIYPPMFALAAYIASPVGIQLLRFRLPFLGPEKRSIAVPLALTLAVLSAASSLRVHPYYTSYFNTLSGGPENGWRLLGFSNIDWGQDILEVDKWLKAHPDRRPLVMDIDYFEMNGNLFDVPTSMPPKLPKGASVDEVRRSITETQWWIISVKKLYNLPDQKGLEYLQQLQPVEKIAYAYHVYRIDPLPADPKAPDLKHLQE
jgi:hypothetical protein